MELLKKRDVEFLKLFKQQLIDDHKFKIKLATRDEDVPCLDVQPCVPSIENPFSNSINLTTYDNCNALVYYDIYYCETINGLTVAFVNFQAYPQGSDSNCDELIEHWVDLLNNSEWEQFQSELDAFMNVARDALEVVFMEVYVEANKNEFECGGDNALSSEFYTRQCFMWCVKYIDSTPSYWLLDQAECGASCCKKETGWCWNTTTNQVQHGNPSYTTEGECEPTGPPSCSSGWTSVGDCEHDTCEP